VWKEDNMANRQSMTVEQALRRISTFPAPGKERVKVGARQYPRSSSDDVPAVIGAAAKEILEGPAQFDLDLAAADDASLVKMVKHLLNMVWPSRNSSDTMHKDTARYVVDWAEANGIEGIEMPDPVHKFAV
jgi:hypothetical protein